MNAANQPNGHGDDATADNRIRHARSPLSGSLPQAGERDRVSLCELHVNGHGDDATADNELRRTRFSLSGPLPQAGERDRVSLREFHVKAGVGGCRYNLLFRRREALLFQIVQGKFR